MKRRRRGRQAGFDITSKNQQPIKFRAFMFFVKPIKTLIVAGKSYSIFSENPNSVVVFLT